MYVDGCKQEVFMGEKDLKSYVKTDTYRLIRSWDLTEQTEQILRYKKMLCGCLFIKYFSIKPVLWKRSLTVFWEILPFEM